MRLSVVVLSPRPVGMGDGGTQSTHFLTDIDPRARVKGSLDPLGFMALWTGLGRTVVGNLTTVTTSPRCFTTLVLALYFAERLVDSGRLAEDRVLEAFLKFEQLAAYSRYVTLTDPDALDERIFGYRRVKRRMDADGAARISAKAAHQLLADQKLYGIWGLYSVAAIASGLREKARPRLTPEARQLVEREHLPRMHATGLRSVSEVERFLLKDADFQPRGKHRTLANALAAVHAPTLLPEERRLFESHLVRPEGPHDPTEGRQRALWQLVEQINDGGPLQWGAPFGMLELREANRRAQAQGHEDLARHLQDIAELETLLAAGARLFSFLGNREHKTPEDVAVELRQHWGPQLSHLAVDHLRGMRGKIAHHANAETAQRLLDLAGDLHAGRYADAVVGVLEQNEAVMRARGKGPWLARDRGRIAIKLQVEWGRLPQGDELPHLFEHPYFLASLKVMGARVTEKEAA
jgi:hypothetical protein